MILVNVGGYLVNMANYEEMTHKQREDFVGAKIYLDDKEALAKRPDSDATITTAPCGGYYWLIGTPKRTIYSSDPYNFYL